ncbi:MAG: hypothetical protein QOJ19_1443, partial [Acidimicrobiia bacterium]|nr:hypothetical protein [Acidimicrobiia bacterium]
MPRMERTCRRRRPTEESECLAVDSSPEASARFG